MEFKSKLVQCSKGHYFNGALHSTCPICQGENAGAGNIGATMPAGDGAPDMNYGGFGSTIPAGDGLNAYAPSHTIPAGDQVGGASPFPYTVPPVGGFGAFEATTPPDDAGPDMSATMIGEDDDESTAGLDPVVGWLVCIDGENKGQDYKIRSGYNYIGRETGDVVIPGDRHISRQNHAMIAYDATDDIYYVGPSAGRNLIKVNGRTLFNAAEIRSYDVISIGTTKLMFIGLCGERFNWSRGRTNG